MLKNRTFVALGLLVVVAAAVLWVKTRKDPHAASDKPAPFKIVKADVDGLEIAEPGKPAIELVKQGSDWKLEKPLADKADPRTVEQALDALAELKLRDVIAESPESYEKVGVKDDEVVKVVPKQGGKPLATLLVGKTTNVRLEGDPRVWSTSNLRRWALVKEPKAFRDRQVLSFPIDQIDKLEASYPSGAKIGVKREAPPPPPAGAKPDEPPPAPGPDRWTLVEGKDKLGGELDTNVPLELASTLGRLTADDVVDSPVADKTGLDKPRAEVTVTLEGGKTHTLLLGKEEGQTAYVKLAGGDRVWTVQKFEADKIPTSPAGWRDKTVVALDPTQVQKIELGHDKERIVLERVDADKFKATAPAGLGELEQAPVQAILRTVQKLRATKVLEGDARANGLDKPRATAAITLKDGKTTRLLFGAEKDGDTPVMVAGGKDVYGLPSYLAQPFLKKADELKKQPAAAPHPGGM